MNHITLNEAKAIIRQYNSNNIVKDIISCLHTFDLNRDGSFKLTISHKSSYFLLCTLQTIDILLKSIPVIDIVKEIILFRFETPLSQAINVMRNNVTNLTKTINRCVTKKDAWKNGFPSILHVQEYEYYVEKHDKAVEDMSMVSEVLRALLENTSSNIAKSKVNLYKHLATIIYD